MSLVEDEPVGARREPPLDELEDGPVAEGFVCEV
jgi:hypothetical protein